MRINSLRNSGLLSVRSFRLSQYLLSKRMVDANSKSLALLKLYRLGNMFDNSSKSSVPRQVFNAQHTTAVAWPSYGFLFVISKNADLFVNQPAAASQMVRTPLQVGCGVGGSPSAAISARACCRASTTFYTQPRVTGPSPAQHCSRQLLKHVIS
jgi:hypothetical protein